MKHAARIALQITVSGGILAYLLWQIDIRRTLDLIGGSKPTYLLAGLAIYVVTTWPMAWRWQVLLASKGIPEPLGWLTKLYFVSYAASQVLPTSVGGDAVRIVEHARRRPEAKGEVAGAVFMERALGSVGTLIMVAVGLAVAVGRYDDVELVVWVELVLVGAMCVIGVLTFSRRAGRHLLERVFPLLGPIRLERPLASLYLALHGYRAHSRTLVLVLAATLAIHIARTVTVWLCGKAVGVDLSPLVYFILVPLLLLVMMVPFTINGLGVREAFFVAFLARFDVGAAAAFATGFLFYAVTVATSLPGGVVLLWRSVRPALVRARPG